MSNPLSCSRIKRLSSIVGAALLLLLASAGARGSEPPRKRAVPDYDGRGGPPPPSPAWWLPRVLLFPAWVATDLVVRRPLSFLLVEIEPGKVAGVAGESGSVSFAPSLLVDLGQRTTVGLLFSDTQLFSRRNSLSLQAGFGGTPWLRLRAVDRVALDAGSRMELHLDAWHRNDAVFHGVGGGARETDRSYHGADTLGGRLDLHHEGGALRVMEPYVRVQRARYRADPCCGPTLGSRIRAGEIERPAGLDGGITVLGTGLAIGVGWPPRRDDVGAAARIDAFIEQAADLQAAGAPRWIHYGATLAGSVDLTGHHRVVTWSAAALFTDPLAGAAVPFTELSTLGGEGASSSAAAPGLPMRGFLDGRVHDRSAAVTTLEYRYPIWVSLDGMVHVAAGNGFGEHLTDMAVRRLRLSFGGGFTSRAPKDVAFELLLAAGTESLEDGAAPSNLRFLFGVVPRF